MSSPSGVSSSFGTVHVGRQYDALLSVVEVQRQEVTWGMHAYHLTTEVHRSLDCAIAPKISHTTFTGIVINMSYLRYVFFFYNAWNKCLTTTKAAIKTNERAIPVHDEAMMGKRNLKDRTFARAELAKGKSVENRRHARYLFPQSQK